MPQANILDPIQASLPPSVWLSPQTPEPQLRPKHAHFITRHMYHVLEAGGYTAPHQWLRLYFTGSLCTYQYSETSDADISLFVDSQNLPEWSRAEMIGLMIEGCDGVTLPGTPYELQGYVMQRGIHPGDQFKQGLRAGYSIDTHKWVSPPDPSSAHDVAQQENGAYIWALEGADKMERMLRYEPDKAVDYYHQIHRRRMRDQKLGKGDFSDANILYKFLAKRNLFPALAQASGEHIAAIMPHMTSEYDPAQDPDDDMHNPLYSDWSVTHDYDPRWDYSDELRPHWQQHPLVQAAQTRLESLTGGGGRVFAADLTPHNAVGIYAFGTGQEEPAVLFDPYQHERHTVSPDEAHQQAMHTIDHEYRHAQQEAMAEGEPDFDEGDAEDWRS